MGGDKKNKNKKKQANLHSLSQWRWPNIAFFITFFQGESVAVKMYLWPSTDNTLTAKSGISQSRYENKSLGNNLFENMKVVQNMRSLLAAWKKKENWLLFS